MLGYDLPTHLEYFSDLEYWGDVAPLGHVITSPFYKEVGPRIYKLDKLEWTLKKFRWPYTDADVRVWITRLPSGELANVVSSEGLKTLHKAGLHRS